MKKQLLLTLIFTTASSFAVEQFNAPSVDSKEATMAASFTSNASWAVKCIKNGTTALEDGSDNYNVAEFNGEFLYDKELTYYAENSGSVGPKKIPVEKIEDIKPIGSEGCFLVKFQK